MDARNLGHTGEKAAIGLARTVVQLYLFEPAEGVALVGMVGGGSVAGSEGLGFPTTGRLAVAAKAGAMLPGCFESAAFFASAAAMARFKAFSWSAALSALTFLRLMEASWYTPAYSTAAMRECGRGA